jgi:hypothetical protein
MRKTISVKYLKSLNACNEAIEEFAEQRERNTLKLFNKIIKSENHKYLNWANWLIVRLMNRKQRIQYVVYAAKQVLSIFEKKYPNDKRPRTAIKAAEKCIKADSNKNRNAAYAAHAAAYAAADATAHAAAHAAYATAYAAYAAAHAAYATAHAAAYAAADAAADAGRNKMKIKILKYGLNILEDNV